MANVEASIQQARAGSWVSRDPRNEILDLAKSALANANRNASRNTYLWRDPAWTMAEAERIAAIRHIPAPGADPELSCSALHGIPVSVKDCFDLAGAPTSCGTRYYRSVNGVAASNSWIVDRLLDRGAIVTGKTHLHPLAYGITGENPDFGDCLQPGNPGALTGGSSSGAAASVMEGSAMAAIGTDTGGSIRVPAALCGLAGYRASLGQGHWRGGAHLAPSFDTMGWLFRHLEDAPLFENFFGESLSATPPSKSPNNFAVVGEAFLEDCESAVVDSLLQCQSELESLGLQPTAVNVGWWSESIDIFTSIQAAEASAIHRGHFRHFEASIRQRLEWGASITAAAMAVFRQRHAAFRDRMDALLTRYDFLLLPAAPVSRLEAGTDHSQTRTRLLRYTSPASLAGMPAVTIPFFADQRPSGGMQLIAARENDGRLLALAAQLGLKRKRAFESSSPAR